MKVADLFYDLSVGELSNLAMSGEGSGSIREKDKGKLIVYTNDALSALHKRFVLRTKEVIVELVDHITNYHLKKQFALSSNSDEKYKYIIDLPGTPFEDDVIRVLEVWDSRFFKLPINDPGQFNSVYLPAPDVVQVLNPVTRNGLSIIYQANRVPLNYQGLKIEEVLDQDINIPDFLVSALKTYISYKVYSHLNGQEHQAKAQEYLSTYEGECALVEDGDLVAQTQSVTHNKLKERGFV